MIALNRFGYIGFYKGILLRSSYEYAFAKYLDFKNIHWVYEEKSFKIQEGHYIPDFFVYENDKLKYIVEVKPQYKNLTEEAKRKLEEVEKIYSVKGKIVTEVELKEFYKEMSCSLTSVFNFWKTESKKNSNFSTNGKNNPHYGLKHSLKTKKKISEMTKRLWKEDAKAKKKMLEGSKKGALKAKKLLSGVEKIPREIRLCKYKKCNKEFKVIQTSNQSYCSLNCNAKNQAKNASLTRWKGNEKIHNEIKEYVLEWSKNNEQLIITTPYNKIKTTIQPLLFEIENRFKIRDIRIVTKAVLGEGKGRKDLLKFLKEQIKNH